MWGSGRAPEMGLAAAAPAAGQAVEAPETGRTARIPAEDNLREDRANVK